MRAYDFLDGLPYYAIGDAEGYQITDCMIHHLKDKQIINKWDFNEPGPAGFPEKWLRQFWRDLAAAPCHVIREDQWSSDYHSILGDRLITWRDDRKEGSNFLERCVELEKCLDHWSVSEPAREWIKQHM